MPCPYRQDRGDGSAVRIEETAVPCPYRQDIEETAVPCPYRQDIEETARAVSRL